MAIGTRPHSRHLARPRYMACSTAIGVHAMQHSHGHRSCEVVCVEAARSSVGQHLPRTYVCMYDVCGPAPPSHLTQSQINPAPLSTLLHRYPAPTINTTLSSSSTYKPKLEPNRQGVEGTPALAGVPPCMTPMHDNPAGQATPRAGSHLPGPLC